MCLSYTAKYLGRLPKRDALNNHSDKLKKERERKKGETHDFTMT